jgi:hypothetical protein
MGYIDPILITRWASVQILEIGGTRSEGPLTQLQIYAKKNQISFRSHLNGELSWMIYSADMRMRGGCQISQGEDQAEQRYISAT